MTRADTKNVTSLWLAAICLLVPLTVPGCTSLPAVHQVSTLQALMQGAYEGQVPCRDLPRYGSLGIGTFDALDGELILLDGRVYQAAADGRVIPDPATTTPFANVVRFEPRTEEHLEGPLSLQDLLGTLDDRTGSKNLLYAVRIDGRFSQVKVRSVPRQSRPYPPLAEAVRGQRVFDLRDVRGTLVGFRFPAYMGGLNMPGWHLHFLSDDRRAGGHVLDLRADHLDVRLQTLRRFEMTLPDRGTFATADLGTDMSAEIHRVEK